MDDILERRPGRSRVRRVPRSGAEDGDSGEAERRRSAAGEVELVVR
jgi:hypothetical protein